MPNKPAAPTADPQQTDPVADPSPSTADPTSREDRRVKEFTEKLTTVETERDTLRTQLEASRRREVDRIAAQHLAVPSDLLTIGAAKLDELLDKDGHVDGDKVTKLAQQLVKDRPGLARGIPGVSPTRPLPGGGTPRTAGGAEKHTLGSILRERGIGI